MQADTLPDRAGASSCLLTQPDQVKVQLQLVSFQPPTNVDQNFRTVDYAMREKVSNYHYHMWDWGNVKNDRPGDDGTLRSV